ncbi:MAG: hypothetical protein LZF62_300103 [Nitrospira sp.]|nr:MAG: hypothetical protein LZF62_300103 [Nitrospira sp.]
MSAWYVSFKEWMRVFVSHPVYFPVAPGTPAPPDPNLRVVPGVLSCES